MTDSQLERTLNSAGKGCFVKYFQQFIDGSLSNTDVAEKMQEEEGYTWKACNSRTSHARSIIKAGRAIDALDMIKGSKAETRVRERAAEIADSLRGSRRI